ncbi:MULTISPECIES: branched-chain amino acid ABC transporter permease [unclassified Bradyrhizobium]|uniref:branched-chain amino acid ABC transporter permease n=1 Tax=unclassified Bradyrhizobium TaxID=2631580 RepID=UPI0032E4187B
MAERNPSLTATPPHRRLRGVALPVLLFTALALVPLAAQFGAAGFIMALLTRTMILALAAMSLDLLIGCGAMISFGHAAFLGIGAYAVGILSSHGIDDAFVQLAAAFAVAGLFALVTGAISLRTRGVYFIMITLAFGQMLYFLATSLAAYGGDDGMSLPSRSRIFGMPLLKNDLTLYYVAFGVLLALYLICRAIVASRFGRVLRGIKENPVRMEAIGFAPYRYQLTAYVIAGLIATLAGCLLANQSEFVSPAYATWQRSGDLIFMAVLGGLGSLHGAILGAVVFTLLEEFLSGLTEYWGLIFGPLLVLVVLFARGGLVGLLRSER